MHRFALALVGLFGCAAGVQPGGGSPTASPSAGSSGSTPIDADGDGVPAGEDCDDGDIGSAPGLAEIRCDGRDNDCQGGDDRTGCDVSEGLATWPFPVEPDAMATSVHPLGDLDGDGREDLAITWLATDNTRYATVVTGIATFAPQVLRFDDAAMVWAAGDVDADGHPDLWVGKGLPDTDQNWMNWTSQIRLARGLFRPAASEASKRRASTATSPPTKTRSRRSTWTRMVEPT